MSLYKYGSFTKELDFTDPDFLEKIEKANQRMKEEGGKIPVVGKQIDILRARIALIDNFFSDVLGEGCCAEMFETNSAKARADAFVALQQAQQESTKEAELIQRAFAPTHTQNPNRQQRRHGGNNNVRK